MSCTRLLHTHCPYYRLVLESHLSYPHLLHGRQKPFHDRFHGHHVCPGPHEDKKMAMQHTKPFSAKPILPPTFFCLSVLQPFYFPSSAALRFRHRFTFRLRLKPVSSDFQQSFIACCAFQSFSFALLQPTTSFKLLVPVPSRPLSTHHGHPFCRQFCNCSQSSRGNNGFITVFTVAKLFAY